MEKPAETSLPIDAAIRRRWSPVAFDPKPIDLATLRVLFEAARWSASSFNEQPWRFIVAPKTDTHAFDQALACLVEPNQAWAKGAAVLILTCFKPTFTHNNKPNRVALHDLGLAAATFTLQATEMGLFVHQMAGILPDVVRATYNVPAEFEPSTGIAIGYPFTGDPATLPDDLRKKQLSPRGRKPLDEVVFTGTWGNAVPGLGS